MVITDVNEEIIEAREVETPPADKTPPRRGKRRSMKIRKCRAPGCDTDIVGTGGVRYCPEHKPTARPRSATRIHRTDKKATKAQIIKYTGAACEAISLIDPYTSNIAIQRADAIGAAVYDVADKRGYLNTISVATSPEIVLLGALAPVMAAVLIRSGLMPKNKAGLMIIASLELAYGVEFEDPATWLLRHAQEAPARVAEERGQGPQDVADAFYAMAKVQSMSLPDEQRPAYMAEQYEAIKLQIGEYPTL